MAGDIRPGAFRIAIPSKQDGEQSAPSWSVQDRKVEAAQSGSLAKCEPSLTELPEQMASLIERIEQIEGRLAAAPESGSSRNGSERQEYQFASVSLDHDEERSELSAVSDSTQLTSSHVEILRAIMRFRRLREEIFGGKLFAEPAWNILLDLTLANAERKPISISSACIASGTPPTTGLRWIGVLEKENLVVRESDPKDARRYYLTLSEKGASLMNKLFSHPKSPF